ncbi:hypothetical protein COV18_05320 [Candidatus Woesearchaeota archaeon CG10_big_fil_rev_8_21_14_0_10_37_12]|nr:MAG: hypothetical protein COV18_05320 [Candidatus Woesearchaeota archaeon CG10_big_fil_rev_8_21_14_0_10_37_12]
MKKLMLLVICLFVITACSDDLPPTPPAPGSQAMVGGAIAGMAGFPAWATQPNNVAITPQQAFYGDGVVLSASNYDYVYENAYYFDRIGTWEKLQLQGTEKQENWIKNRAIGSIQITEPHFESGTNYAVVYACNKQSGNWNCNGNKWMLLEFNVQGTATGAIPELANVNQFVVNQAIYPFTVINTGAEQDNFADINVIRYDAKYREPKGLVVLVHVFDFNNRAELDQTINTMFRDIFTQGKTKQNGNNIGIYLDETDTMITTWSSGKQIVYIQTFDPEAANKEIIEAYLAKYPSDVQ